MQEYAIRCDGQDLMLILLQETGAVRAVGIVRVILLACPCWLG